jgi:hypothetical protein
MKPHYTAGTLFIVLLSCAFVLCQPRYEGSDSNVKLDGFDTLQSKQNGAQTSAQSFSPIACLLFVPKLD